MRIIFLLSCLLFSYETALAKTWTYRVKAIDPADYDKLAGQSLQVKDLEKLTRVYEIAIETDTESLPSPALASDLFHVCANECNDSAPEAAPSRVDGDVVEFIYPVDTPQFRQANVFYFIETSLAHFKKLGYEPGFRASFPVRVDRKIDDLLFVGEMKNNAFFDSTDNSLNFVPSQTVEILYGLLGKATYLDSAYDPVVITHELAHLVIHDFAGEFGASDFLGVHEGIADFFALRFHGATHQGAILGAGKPFRKAIGAKRYEIGVEAHERGEVLLQSLYKVSERLQGTEVAESLDQVVFEGLLCAKHDAFISFSSMSACLLDTLSGGAHGSLSASDLQEVESILNGYGIKPQRYRSAPTVLPENIPTTGHVVYQTIRSELPSKDPHRTWIKIHGGTIIEDYAWYVIQSKSKKESAFDEPVVVLVDLLTAQIYRAWLMDGTQIQPDNLSLYKKALESSHALHKLVEQENSKWAAMTKDPDPLVMNVEDCQYQVSTYQLPCKSYQYRSWLNVLLRLVGFEVTMKKLVIKQVDPKVLPVSPFRTVLLDADFEIGKDKTAERFAATIQLEDLHYENSSEDFFFAGGSSPELITQTIRDANR